MNELQATPTIEGVTSAFNREAVEARAESEPAWLRERRLAAWAVYESTPLPTTRSEQWRYTDPKMLLWDRVETAPSPESMPAEARSLLSGKDAAGTVLQYGTSLLESSLDAALRAKGVILTDLATAAIEHRELVKENLGTRARASSRRSMQHYGVAACSCTFRAACASNGQSVSCATSIVRALTSPAH